ncbi:MAG TPA: type II toxin-antitoxin system HipA family toxin [Prolixibacteraceae bacterium]|nr:type II toxin-antitoxin system HipA family toxin [Prolixibacteraceae bacterium]
MNRCPITYDECSESLYSEKGLKLLSPALKSLGLLNYTAEELRAEAMQRASKMSIQGVQPKLSAILNIKDGLFEIVDKGGRYILKPQHHIFPELPQNEDLTMRLAESIGIDIPLHGLIYSKDRSLTYFIRRFDRKGQKDKVAVEDFAQLAGMSRDTKYNYSMEKLVKLIDDYCTFPAIEKARLFKLVLFNYLVGNEDMHLKNYSVIIHNGKVELSPAYDLLNSSIVLRGDMEEIALSLNGKKRNLNREILVNYFGKERCNLTDKVIEKILKTIQVELPSWLKLIEISFLSEEMKEKYSRLLQKRINILGLEHN